MKLKGKTVFVSGGASGLGEAAVRLFAANGANVVICDINDERGKSLANELGPCALFCHVDITDEESVKKALIAAVERFGGVHVAISSAGIGYAQRIVSKSGRVHPINIFKRVLDINIVGTFNVVRLSAQVMTKNTPDPQTGERGVIINVSSVAAMDGQIGQAAYSASKGAVVGMTLPIARDLSIFGIRIVTICPGIFETPMTEKMPQQMKQKLESLSQFPQRLGNANEFASLTKHITENTFLNGEVIRLDAGARMPPK